MPQYFFGAGVLYATPQGPDNLAIGAQEVGALQGVTVEMAAPQKAVYGHRAFPAAAARGGVSIRCKAQAARFSPAAFDAYVFGGSAPPAGRTRMVTEEPHTVVAGAVAATGPGYTADMGVRDALTDDSYTRVLAGPVGLQYTADDAGNYAFNASRNGAGVLLSYMREDTAGQRLQVGGRAIGHTPAFTAVLTGEFDGKAVTLVLYRCVVAKFSMGARLDNFIIPDLDFLACSGGALDSTGQDSPGTIYVDEYPDTGIDYRVIFHAPLVTGPEDRFRHPVTQQQGVVFPSTPALYEEGAAMIRLDDFSGGSNGIQYGIASDLDIFSSGDFTVECWVYSRSAALNPRVIAQFWPGGPSYAYPEMAIEADSFSFTYNTSETAQTSLRVSSTINYNAWTHVAMMREGDYYIAAMNGVVTRSTTLTYRLPPAAYGVCIGNVYVGFVYAFNGSIYDFRIVQGRALYPENYTPPTGPLPDN